VVTRRITKAGVAVLIAGAALAVAPRVDARPVAGGHYRGPQRDDPDVVVDVRLADDGREFALFSWIGFSQQCREGRYSALNLGAEMNRAYFPGWRAVQVGRAGTFRYARHDWFGSRSYIEVRGRLAGRALSGSIVSRRPHCTDVHASYRARLIGTPNATRPGAVARCDRVTVGYPDDLDDDEAYEPQARGIGCTRARELARRWHHSRDCGALTVGQGHCRVGGAVCTAIRGGRFAGRASARCSIATRPAGTVELVHYTPCMPGDTESLWTINMPCPTAERFPVDDLIADEGREAGCVDSFVLERPKICEPIAGFTCRVRDDSRDASNGFFARCVRDADNFEAFVFRYDFG
jgi:hypothetical protein